MSYINININEYINMIWTSFKDNIIGFYYFLWNTSPTETESENETDNSQSGVIQMEKVEIQNADKNHIEKLEFIVSKEFNKDISKEQLINIIKIEVQYINKKMSCKRNQSNKCRDKLLRLILLIFLMKWQTINKANNHFTKYISFLFLVMKDSPSLILLSYVFNTCFSLNFSI